MTTKEAQAIQADLLAVFEKHGLAVAVGIGTHGVVVRSQDRRVEATNLAPVRAYS